MLKINILKIILLIILSLLIIVAFALALIFYTIRNNDTTNNTEIINSSLSSNPSSNKSIIDNSSNTDEILSSQNTFDKNNNQSDSDSTYDFDQDIYGGLLEDPTIDLDSSLKDIRTRFLFSDNGIKVYTSTEKRSSGNGWAGNLGINPSIFFVDTHTYIDYQEKTYYVGPSVDYINLINDTWYLAIQTDYNEYILYSCDFECKNQRIIIPDPTRKIVNVMYSKSSDRIILSTIAVNDRFAIPVEAEYQL